MKTGFSVPDDFESCVAGSSSDETDSVLLFELASLASLSSC